MSISTHSEAYSLHNSSVLMRRKITALVTRLSKSQLHALLFHAESFVESESARVGTHVALSKREQEVLILLSEGYSRRQIGMALGITINTAAKHISNTYQKIGVTTVAEATRFAVLNKSIFD